MTAAKTKAQPVAEPEEKPEEPLYGDKPTFSYTPKDGGDPIVFPAHSTTLGEVEGKTYLEFLWEMDEYSLGVTDQIFAYLRRSGATPEMKRRVTRLPRTPEDEVREFFQHWINESSDIPQTGLPPES
jgi:hypothetical protein